MLGRCYGCLVVNGQYGIFFIFFIDDFSAPFNELKSGMRGGLISGDQQVAYGLVCCYTWAAPFGTYPTVSLFTGVTPLIQSMHGCSVLSVP